MIRRALMLIALYASYGCATRPAVIPTNAAQSQPTIVRPQINVQPTMAMQCDSTDLLKTQLAAAQREANSWRAYSLRLEKILSIDRPNNQ